jgi:hypothetical protein
LKKTLQYLLAGVCLALLPSMALAQSSISGVVKDASGAVVAGASVQAASDVLIEKVRTVTTNGEGRYAIIDLRPGQYVVTTTAQGFAAVKQTVDVPANVTVPVDATLKVGSVGETVNVEARVATVDIENAAHPQTLSRSEMDSLPTGRYMQSIGSYTPGAHLNVPDIGGSQQIEQNYISLHGNGSVHDTYTLDGLLINTTYSDGQIQQYVDNAAIQESTYQSSNVTAEASGGGMMTNLVPKDGGNDYHLQVFAGGSGGSGFWQGSNIDTNIIKRGFAGQDAIVKIEDFDGSFGGPIKRDKLWFMLTGRDQVTFTQAGGSTYPNGAPGIQDGTIYAGTFRLTYQLNQNNKLTAFILRNWKYKGHEILDTGIGIPADPSVAATQRSKWPMYYIFQTKWTGTPTPKLVTEAGISISHLDYNDLYQPGVQQLAFSPSWYTDTSAYDTGLGRRYIAGFYQQYFQTNRNVFEGNATYVTGSHQLKFGAIYSFGPNRYSANMNGDGWNSFSNATPQFFTAFDTPFYQRPYLDADIGLYVTDTWHYKRLSVTAGLRWEYLAAEIQPENAPAGRFVAARSIPDITCDTIKGMGCWKDWTPRLGVVYDVFGNHKTAIKAGFGKYNTQYSTGFTSNFNPMVLQSETVAWNTTGLTAAGGACSPSTLAGLLAPNPLCYATGGFNAVAPVGGLGPNPNPSFGLSTQIPALDPNFHREYNLQYTLGLQQELRRGLTLNANWYRRSNYQTVQLQNEAVTASQWTASSIINPIDGSTIPVYNLNALAPAPILYQTNGPQSLVRNTYTGYEASVVGRFSHGTFVMFGWTIDRQLDRSCGETANALKLNDPNSLRFCDWFGNSSLSVNGINVASMGAVPSPPWQNEFKASASYNIKWGVIASVSLYSNRYQGGFAAPSGATVITANDGYLARTWTITTTTRYPTDCTACGSLAGQLVDPNLKQGAETINLVAPGQVLTPRLNQLDLSFKKTFKFREKYTAEPTIQLFNMLNSNAVIAQGTAIGSSIQPFLPASACTSSSAANCGLGGTPTNVTNARLLRLALMFRF